MPSQDDMCGDGPIHLAVWNRVKRKADVIDVQVVAAEAVEKDGMLLASATVSGAQKITVERGKLNQVDD